MRWGWFAGAVVQAIFGLTFLAGGIERPPGRVGGAILLLSAVICLLNALPNAGMPTLRGWRPKGRWPFWILVIVGYGLAFAFEIPQPEHAPHKSAAAKPSAPAPAPKPSRDIADAKKPQADTMAAAKARAADEKNVIGRWLHPVMGVYIIKKTAAGYDLLLESEGSTLTMTHLKKRRSAKGLRLDDPDSESDDHFIILPNGKLDLRDKDGEIITLEPALGKTPAVRAEELNALNAQMHCASDINCVVQNNLEADEPACKESIEARARWDFKWSGWGSIFSGYRFNAKSTSQHQIIDYYGDSLQFQNGFGAWMNMRYICTVDIQQNKITDLKILPGHIAR